MLTTTPRALLVAAALIAFAVIVAAWWITSGGPRYQLVNVGGGETHRLDRTTGTITSCAADRCVDLTDGAEPRVAGADEWPGTPVPTGEVPPPPEGYTLDD